VNTANLLYVLMIILVVLVILFLVGHQVVLR